MPVIHTIYTDASYCAETKIAAFAYRACCPMGIGLKPIVMESGILDQQIEDSGSAEISAAVRAVLGSIASGRIRKGDIVNINADCVQAIKVLSGEHVPITASATVARDLFFTTVKRLALDIRMKHVKAHSDRVTDSSNRWCDEACRNAMRNERKRRVHER